MLFNVAQLLREPIGAERTATIEGDVPVGDDDALVSHIQGTARLVRTHRGLLVYIDFVGVARDLCSRCLRAAETPVQVHAEEEFFPTIDVTSGAPLPKPPDGSVFLIDENHHLDLTEAVRQAFVMAQPMQLLCRPDCVGLCPRCGADLNSGPCACPQTEIDPRWAALSRLAVDR